MKSLTYFPLESYESRYTGLMSCANGWVEKAFSPVFSDLTVIRPKQETSVIKNGEVLDAVQRPVYAMQQNIEYLSKNEGCPTRPSSVYVDDFFHPGIESLAYAFRKAKPLLYTFCWAQSFDRYDFTRKMTWMRTWEIMASQHYSKVFVASPILQDLISTSLPYMEEKIEYVGLPFSSSEVLKVREKAVVSYDIYDVIFTSRLDKEKQFLKFCMLADELGGKYRFAVSTAYSQMYGTDVEGIALATALVKQGKLTVFLGMDKPSYYSLLSSSRIQVNFSLQDWVSFTLLEALTFKCVPIYPNFRDFSYVFRNAPELTYSPDASVSSIANLIETVLRNYESPFFTELAAELGRDTLAFHDGSLKRIAESVRNHSSAHYHLEDLGYL